MPAVRSSVLRLCLCLCLCVVAGCEVDLYHGLGERQANEALVALRAVGIPADKRLDQRSSGARPPTFRLCVASADESRALGFLLGEGLPRLPEQQRETATLLPLPAEQRAALAQRLAAEMSATLESLPQVLEARVHLVLRDGDSLSPAGTLRPTAAVLLRLRGASPPLAPGEVERLLAASVPGLDKTDVTVITAPSSLPALAPTPVASMQSLRLVLGLLALAAAALMAILGWRRLRPLMGPPPRS